MAWKTLFSILGIIIIAALGFGYRWLKNNENAVLDFIKKNPERSSIYWMRNDTIMADLRGDKKFPLASTVKIIIAIEYAQQAASGKINPHEAIPLADLALSNFSCTAPPS